MSRTTTLNAISWLLHLAGAVIVAALVAIAYFTVCASFAWQTTTRTKRITELEEYLSRAPEIRAQHLTLKQTLVDLEQRSREIDQRIPDDPREAEFLRHVTEAAQQVGLAIRDYRRGRITEKENHFELEVRILGEGRYASICQFLERLHGLRRAITVDKMQVNAEEETDAYPIDLTLLLYYRGAEQESAEEEQLHG